MGVLLDIQQAVVLFKLMYLIVDEVMWVLDDWQVAVLACDVKELNSLTNNLAPSEPCLHCCEAVVKPALLH